MERGSRSIDQNALDSLQFNEEIQPVMTLPADNANSFTALLELPAPQAVELLHHNHSLESNHSPAEPTVKADGRYRHQSPYHFNPGANLTFPSNSALIERAAKFSVFAGELNNNNCNKSMSNSDNNNNNSNNNNYSPETTGSGPSNASGNLGKVKNEPAESDSNNNNDPNSLPPLENQNQRTVKRKEREKKGKAASKKSKIGANDSDEDAEKLPYVHVRARRGQATDSHSLAERARREKINARMKLLQELVPGCNKISGTASVLDEIINHVQSLQHQVELLSMRLASVNPRIDFNLDSTFAVEGGPLMDINFPDIIMPVMWPEIEANGNRQQYQQQWHNFDGHQLQPIWGREEESHNFITPENSLLSYGSSANSASLHSNQLKMEL